MVCGGRTNCSSREAGRRVSRCLLLRGSKRCLLGRAVREWSLDFEGHFFKKAAVIPQASKNGSKENRASRFSHKEEREGKGGFHGWRSETGGLLRIEVSKNKTKKKQAKESQPSCCRPWREGKSQGFPRCSSNSMPGCLSREGQTSVHTQTHTQIDVHHGFMHSSSNEKTARVRPGQTAVHPRGRHRSAR